MINVERLNTFISEGRVIRGQWRGTDAQGRETACLLAALAPECGREQRAGACPADVMPRWLAHLVPWMDDEGTAEQWPGMVRRFAAVAARWHVLTPEQWQRLEWTAKLLTVTEARQHTSDPAALEACDGTIALLQDAIERGTMDESRRVAAYGAADSAAWGAAYGAADSAAYGVAWSAAWSAAYGAAYSAAESAAWGAAASAAASAAVDRLTAAILGAIETACDGVRS